VEIRLLGSSSLENDHSYQESGKKFVSLLAIFSSFEPLPTDKGKGTIVPLPTCRVRLLRALLAPPFPHTTAGSIGELPAELEDNDAITRT
jgi:hypothetical protein